MTLALALEATDGLILATDSRTAIEDEGRRIVMDTSIKLYQLAHHVALAEGGAGDLARYLITKVQAEVESTGADGISEVFELARPKLMAKYDEAVRREEAKASVSFIFGGMDRDANGDFRIPRILSMYSHEGFRPLQATTGMDCTGTTAGIWITEYLFSRFYSRGMRIGAVAKLASLFIGEVASQDWKVGGPIQMAEVTGSGLRFIEPPSVALTLS